MNVAVFTGHREVELTHGPLITAAVDRACEWADQVVLGGARGFDTLALLGVLARANARQRVPKVIIVVPATVGNQPRESVAAIGDAIMAIDPKIVELDLPYTGESLKYRNVVMINHCEGNVGRVTAYWNGQYKSGTWSAISYAKAKGIDIDYVLPLE